MYDQNDVRWIAKGMTYQSVKQASSSPTAPPPGLNDEIQIPESGDELIMKPGDTGKSIFGMAIDGQLAVFYIRKLWTTIGQSNLLDLRKNVKSLLANIALEFSSKHGMDAAKIESWMKEITDYANTAQSWILELLNQSAAITMSKNYILKTLSQPGCEGIRFYLCMKDRPKETKDKENEDKTFYPKELLDQILTFATTGVDGQSCDLHYKYPENQPQAKAQDDIPNIENCSLSAEYSYTSGNLSSKKFTDPDLTPYALFKYAKTE